IIGARGAAARDPREAGRMMAVAPSEQGWSDEEITPDPARPQLRRLAPRVGGSLAGQERQPQEGHGPRGPAPPPRLAAGAWLPQARRGPARQPRPGVPARPRGGLL